MVPLVSMEDFKGKQPRRGSSLADIFCLVGCVAREKLRQIRKNEKTRTLGVDEVDDHDKGFQFGSTSQPYSSKGKELVSCIPYSVGPIRRERCSVRANYTTPSDSGLTKRKRIDGGEHGKESSLKPKPNKMKIKEEQRLGIKNPKEHIRAPSYSTNPNDLPEKFRRKIETSEGIESYEKVKTAELDSSMGKELVVSPLYSVGTKTTSDSESHHKKSGVTKKKKNKKKKSIDDKDSSLKLKPVDMKRSGVKRPHIRAPRYSTNPNDLPEELKRKIESLEGIESFEKAKMTLVIEKHLFLTDIAKSANRLSMPLKQIKPESFLDEDEIEYLAAEKNWPLSVISPLLEEEDLTLKQWNMVKDNGSVSSSYVLKKNWNEVRNKNGLKKNDLVQVWSFRDVGNNLHLALVLAEKATSDDSGSNVDGSRQPSTSPSTASPSNNEHGGESVCDIAEGEETSEQNENREIKDESSGGGRRRSTPSNNDNDGEKSSDISEGKETREQDENCDEIRGESSSERRRSENVSQDDEVVAPIR